MASAGPVILYPLQEAAHQLREAKREVPFEKGETEPGPPTKRRTERDRVELLTRRVSQLEDFIRNKDFEVPKPEEEEESVVEAETEVVDDDS